MNRYSKKAFIAGVAITICAVALLYTNDKSLAIAAEATISESATRDGDASRAEGVSSPSVVQPAQGDFTGDGKSDFYVWRPSTGNWVNGPNNQNIVHFGTSGDIIVPGNYDGSLLPGGDRTTDFAVFRPSNGTWYIATAAAPSSYFAVVQFGLSTDLPVQADFDGDGATDIAVYRPSTGFWYILGSTAGFSATKFGLNGDKPVPGDYDGDGKADIAVYRPSDGNWYLLQSTAGFVGLHWGISTDFVVPADYDGDGKTDLAVYRSDPPYLWYIFQSTAGSTVRNVNSSGGVPVPGDYDGDGKADVGNQQSTGGGFQAIRFVRSSDGGPDSSGGGVSGDIPVLTHYVPTQ